jgi:hypothetical protein
LLTDVIATTFHLNLNARLMDRPMLAAEGGLTAAWW